MGLLNVYDVCMTIKNCHITMCYSYALNYFHWNETMTTGIKSPEEWLLKIQENTSHFYLVSKIWMT